MFLLREELLDGLLELSLSDSLPQSFFHTELFLNLEILTELLHLLFDFLLPECRNHLNGAQSLRRFFNLELVLPEGSLVVDFQRHVHSAVVSVSAIGRSISLHRLVHANVRHRLQNSE